MIPNAEFEALGEKHVAEQLVEHTDGDVIRQILCLLVLLLRCCRIRRQ